MNHVRTRRVFQLRARQLQACHERCHYLTCISGPSPFTTRVSRAFEAPTKCTSLLPQSPDTRLPPQENPSLTQLASEVPRQLEPHSMASQKSDLDLPEMCWLGEVDEFRNLTLSVCQFRVSFSQTRLAARLAVRILC